MELCSSLEGGLCEELTQNKHCINYPYSQELNSRVVGVGVVSNVHSIASGSGLHISVPSHVTLVTADTYPASHWMVTMDPGNLLKTCPNAPFMGLVNTGQPSERNINYLYGKWFINIKESVELPILKLYPAVVLFPAQLVATTLIV